ncbi:uncharacterized protein LOC142317609 [Lycorma delicatula]|uniref:uncharacterized protein LOC142317609 n=1 Tax=Lycorma delicatula TaxID=130591 RepID=UPI003F5199C7
MQEEWKSLFYNLSAITNLRVDRFVLSKGTPKTIQLHGFCDASEKAYGACIYLRTTDDVEGIITVKLLCSRSRVAPLKKYSLPRSELCGAVVLTRLFHKLEKTVSENLKAVVQDLKNLKASNECVISELTDKNSLLTRNIENLKSELSISNKRSAKLGEEITNCKTELSSLNSQILSDEKTIEELRLIEKENNVFLESHKNCEEIKAKLKLLNEINAKLELDNKSLRSENDALKEDQHRLHIESVKAVKNWENLEKELVNKNNDLENKLTVLKQDMVSSLEKKDTLLQDLTSECELLRKQLKIFEALKTDLENVQQNYQNEKTIVGSLRAEIHELENLHSSNLIVISELGERNSTLTQNLEALKSELSVSDNKIEKLEEAIASYKTELISLNAKLLSNEKRIEELDVIDEEYNVLLESHKKCDEIKVKLISLNEIHAQLLVDNKLNAQGTKIISPEENPMMVGGPSEKTNLVKRP